MSISNFRLSDDRHVIDVEAQAARFDAQFPKTSAVLTQVTQGMGDVGDGTFATGPKGLVQYVSGATNQLGETTEWSQVFSKYALNWTDNPVSRVGWAAGNMVYGILHLATGPETYDVRGVTQWGMSIAMLVAVPEGIKTGKMMARGATRMVPALDAALTRAEGVAALQQIAKVTLQRILAADDAAFAQAWKNAAPAGQMGAIEIPQWMLPALGKADYLKLFRQAEVTIADLEAMTQFSDRTASTAAKQVLAERMAIIPEGYVQIPGGEFKGQEISPFAMKATLVTNVEWFQGLDGKPRYVTLEWNQTTHTVVVKDISTTPPAFLNPKLNLEAGEIATQGSQVLVKLVDNPSRGYDAAGRVFSGENQPAVGVTYFHAKAWLRTLEAGGKRVYGLPEDLQFEAVASNFGKFEYGTETGQLVAADGRKLAHFGDTVTVVVDDPRYPAGPFGVQTTGNVWRWTEANPQETSPYGLRGGSWSFSDPEFLRAAFRDSFTPVGRYDDVGFSPVVLPGLPK